MTDEATQALLRVADRHYSRTIATLDAYDHTCLVANWKPHTKRIFDLLLARFPEAPVFAVVEAAMDVIDYVDTIATPRGDPWRKVSHS